MWHANYEVAVPTSKGWQTGGRSGGTPEVLTARERQRPNPQPTRKSRVDLGLSLTSVAILLEATGKTGEAEVMYRKAETQ